MSAVHAGLILTALTAATSYIAIRTVPLAALNSSRIQLLLDHYVSVNAAIVNPAKIGLVRLPFPSELCAVDPVAPSWAMPWSSVFCPSIEVNRPIRDILPGTVRDSPEKLRMLVTVHAGHTHLLMRDGRARSSKLHVLLREDASPEDAIMAMLHAILVRCALDPPSPMVRLYITLPTGKHTHLRLFSWFHTRNDQRRRSRCLRMLPVPAVCFFVCQIQSSECFTLCKLAEERSKGMRKRCWIWMKT